jgi:iron complex transport system substrate-binding protein
MHSPQRLAARSRSRRSGTTLAALVAAVALLLSACGSDGSSDAAAGSGASPAADAFPVTIEHARGSTTIEEQPTRIVTVGYTDVEPVLALGFKPVGALPWFGEDLDQSWPWVQDAWGDEPPEYVATASDINYEKLAALQPDLILGLYADLDKPTYEKLSAIAPTVAQNGDYEPYATPWDEMTRVAGEALGRSDEAEELIADIEGEFAAAREAHPEFADLTAVVTDPNGGSFFAFGPLDPRGVFTSSLGFSQPEEVSDYLDGKFGDEVSMERLDLFEADRLLVLADGSTPDDLAANKLYQGLDVVKSGNAIEVPYSDAPAYGAAVAYNTVLSIPYALEHIVPLLADPSSGG